MTRDFPKKEEIIFKLLSTLNYKHVKYKGSKKSINRTLRPRISKQHESVQEDIKKYRIN